MNFVYHGSYAEIKNPDLNRSRTDIDFGRGFYLTEDKKMAEKWAVGKAVSIVNSYELNLHDLKVVRLGLTKQWLDFVAYNRGYGDKMFDTEEIDVIIGPTADDKMFNTLSAYFAGFLSAEQTIRYLNIAGYSNQIVLKTNKAIQNLSFVNSKEINGYQKETLIKQVIFERKNANTALKELMSSDKKKEEKKEKLVDDVEQERRN